MILQINTLKKPVRDVKNHIMAVLIKGKTPENELELKRIIKNELYQKIDPLTSKVNELIDIQLKQADELKTASDEIYARTIRLSILAGVLSLVITTMIGFSIITDINKSMKVANT